MNKAAQAYFQTKVSTTDQGQLLLMLYDGALNFLQQARDKMIAKDYAAKGLLISRAIDIVNELSSTLNMEKGGTLAENLNNLYFLCTARLLQANLKMNLDQLDSVVGILSGLRSAYAQIIETPEAQQAGAEIAARMNPAASMAQRAMPTMGTAPTMNRGVAGQMQARAAYGQQAGRPAPAAPAAPAAPSPAAPISTAAAPAVAATAQAEAALEAVAQAATVYVPPVQPLAPVSAPQPAAAEADLPLSPPSGGLTKRMALYGKFAQGA